MKPVRLLAFLVATLLIAATARGGEWITLFDGSSTAMWRGYRQSTFPARGWVVEDGALRVMAGGGGGDIVTRDCFENFELVLEWKAAPRANSGVMYRVAETGGSTWNTGPEYQIFDDLGHNLAPDHINSTGALYDLKKPSADKKAVVRPAGEWNETRIVLNRGVVEHWLNGVKLLEDDLNGDDWKSRVAASKFRVYADFGQHARGRIALQDHGNDVWFRNIRIRDLDMPSHSAVTPVPRGDAWWKQRLEAMQAEVNKGDAQILLIGDSITQGWEGPGKAPWEGELLPRKAVNLGIGGDRTQHVLWRLKNGNLDGIAPRFAFVMIGTNNSNGEDNTVTEIADGVRAIVNTLRDRLPTTKIVLWDIFPRGDKPNPQRGKIAQVNQILARLHDGERVFFRPIGHLFIEDDGSISNTVMPDFLHLSPEAYGLWWFQIEKTLMELGE